MHRKFKFKQCLLPLYNGKMIRIYIANISDQNLYNVELKVISNAVELITYIKVPDKYIIAPNGFIALISYLPKRSGFYIEYSIYDPCNMNNNILNYIQILKAETRYTIFTIRNSVVAEVNGIWSNISMIDIKIKYDNFKKV
ncbi:hypothetical protein AN641_07210 [Candidatus Epulonipiscioides gigas]|nr:hypothetical protein AN641_07210 [Epulopiscium sp. SCG-C07WGA-EpuloA2]